MATNPYQPPSDLPDGDSVIDPPEYHGGLTTVRGSVTAEEAVVLAKSCKAIDVGSDAPKVNQGAFRTNLTLLIIIVAAMCAIFFVRGARTAPAPTPTATPDVMVIIVFVAVPLVIFGVVFFLIRRSSSFASSDPPLEGETTLRLSDLGLSVEKTTRDHRTIEAFCSWRQLHVTEGPEAWLFYVGLVDPVLVAKRWIEEPAELETLTGFLRSVAGYRASRPPVTDITQVEDEASAAFPDYDTDAVSFQCDAKLESRVRKKIASSVKKELREYRASPLLRGDKLKIGLGVTLGIIVAAIIQSLRDSSDQGILARYGLFAALAVFSLIVLAGIGIRNRLLQSQRVHGAVSDTDVWFNYRMLLLRLPLDSFPFRKRIDDAIVLGTPTGSSVVVLPRGYFDSESSFESLSKRLVGEN